MEKAAEALKIMFHVERGGIDVTREEFMASARQEIEEVVGGRINRIMNLVAKAWAEGKKNAETDQVEAILREALKRFEPPETVIADPDKCSCWHLVQTGIHCGEPVYEQRCWGTPERSICTCGGDKSRCDFYGG